MLKTLKYFIMFSLIFVSYTVSATHAAGMDISYECLTRGSTSDSYRITIKFYRDCSGVSAPSAQYISGLTDISSSCGSRSINFSQIGNAVNLNPQCATYCNGGNTVGIEEFTYEGIVNLSHCTDWNISVCIPNRNPSINTIQNPGQQQLCIEANLDNSIYCNNSPTFTQYPTPFICSGNFYCYNNGAIEIDGDSLVYSLINPLISNTGNTVTYLNNYSPSNPVGGNATFDQITGNICVNPPGIIAGILAIKVEEYRNGILIGSVIRDIQINALPCGSVNPPQLSGIDTNNLVNINDSSTYVFNINCPNGMQNFSFDINTINQNNPPPPPPPSATIIVTINTMSWGNEISWDITSGGNVYATGGGYNSNSTYIDTICVPIGPLIFNMYDSYGDGWNGGTYTISGNPTLTGNVTGTMNWGTYLARNFSINGGNPCNLLTTNGGPLVNMTWNSGIPGANFTVLNNNTMNPVGTFSWTPSLSDTINSPFFFYRCS